MEQHETPNDAASGTVVPLFYMRAPMRPCQRTLHIGICEMEQWNRDMNEVTKPRKTRAVSLSERSILCSIIVEQWNKARHSSDG